MKTILMTGVCGVGKSTLSSELSQSIGCTWGDYADIMLDVMGETDKDKIQFLEEMDKLDIIDKAELVASERFADASTDDKLHIFENHLSIVQDGEILTFPMTDYDRYNSIGIIVVEALCKTIIDRRKTDPARSRLVETDDLIDRQQQINLKEANKVSSYLDIPYVRIVNEEKDLSIAALRSWCVSLTS